MKTAAQPWKGVAIKPRVNECEPWEQCANAGHCSEGSRCAPKVRAVLPGFAGTLTLGFITTPFQG
jgi:hypothetical protein